MIRSRCKTLEGIPRCRFHIEGLPAIVHFSVFDSLNLSYFDFLIIFLLSMCGTIQHGTVKLFVKHIWSILLSSQHIIEQIHLFSGKKFDKLHIFPISTFSIWYKFETDRSILSYSSRVFWFITSLYTCIAGPLVCYLETVPTVRTPLQSKQARRSNVSECLVLNLGWPSTSRMLV